MNAQVYNGTERYNATTLNSENAIIKAGDHFSVATDDGIILVA